MSAQPWRSNLAWIYIIMKEDKKTRRQEDMKSFEVNATLEVIDDTWAGDTNGRTFVVNSVNFDNSDNSLFPSSLKDN